MDLHKEELLLIVKDWIETGKHVNYLLELRQPSDAYWLDIEVMLYVLSDNVFDLVDIEKLAYIASIGSANSISSVDLQDRLKQLIIDSQMANLNEEEKCKRERNNKLCTVIEKVFKVCDQRDEREYCNDDEGEMQMEEDSKIELMCEQMFDYIVKLIEKCEHEETFFCAWNALIQFPFDKFSNSTINRQFHKYESSVRKLIDSSDNLLNKEQIRYRNYWDLCFVLGWVTQNPLSRKTCNKIFDFYLKVLKLFEDAKMTKHAFEAIGSFHFYKYQPSLLALIDLVKSKLNDEQTDWDRHLGLCEVMNKLIINQEFLSHKTCDRMFDYIVKLIETCDHRGTIDRACDVLARFSTKKSQPLMIKIYQNLKDNLRLCQNDWQKHQNWCRMLDKMTYDCKDFDLPHLFYNQNLTEILFDYFMAFFDACNHMPTVLNVLLSIEKLCMIRLFGDEQLRGLKDKIMDCFLLNECPFYGDFPCDFDYARHEVEWCARWFVDNLTGQGEIEKWPQIKLSHDGTGARNDRADKDVLIPVRSAFDVTSGIYFYEVTILTSGYMRFGWSCETRFEEFNDFGDDRNSICFDTSQRCLWHNETQCSSVNQSDCRAGDVIGCLLDCDRGQFVFYYNGQQVDCSEEVHFLATPYYVMAGLATRQHCQFNFGQVPFKFIPKDIHRFSDFHKASGNDARKYRLLKTGLIDENFWFKHITHDNQVSLLFRDEIQNEFDSLVTRVEENIRNELDFGNCDLDYVDKVDEMDEGLKGVRYIQAIIETMGKVGRGDMEDNEEEDDPYYDVITQWVGMVVEMVIDKINNAILLELLYPYIQLQVISGQDSFLRHRNICIVLSHLIMFSKRYEMYSFIDEIRSEIFTYLTRTLKSTHDEWTQLFVLIALADLGLNENEKKVFKKHETVELLTKHDDYLSRIKSLQSDKYMSLYNYSFSCQINFACEHINNKVLKPSRPSQPNPAALNINDRTKHLKLSSNHLTIRSDCKWQSVRSVSQVNKEIYYFEAILLTSGEMRFGWSTKRTELDQTEIGADDFSIGFDGYNRGVWHKNEMFKLESSAKRWKVGDVVGCLIEVVRNRESNDKEKKFSFYLNGRLINYKAVEPIYSSPHPYHASISLYYNQQANLNFGQTAFKYPPKKDYWNFYLSSKDLLNRAPPIIMGNITNAIVAVDAPTTIEGSVSMSYKKVLTSSEIEHILKKGLTSEFIICPACYKKIYLKRFFADCCECLKLTLEKSNGNERLAITSTEQSTQTTLDMLTPLIELHSRKRKHSEEVLTCLLCQTEMSTKRLKFDCCEHIRYTNENIPSTDNENKFESNSSKRKLQKDESAFINCQICQAKISTKRLKSDCCEHIRYNHDDQHVTTLADFSQLSATISVERSSTEFVTKCPLCHQLKTSKLLRFTCCDHLQFCFECGKQLDDCLKCRAIPFSSKAPQVNQQLVQCQLCDQVKQTRALQFVGCEHMKLCRDCVPDILDCPKCKTNKK